MLHSYFFRVHVDYLATHLIRFSFFQHKFLRSNSVSPFFHYINLNALTSALASSESLQYSHNWLAYFPPVPQNCSPFRSWSGRWHSRVALSLSPSLSLSQSIFLFRAAEMKWIKVTGSLWMLPQAAASLCPSSLGTLVVQLITFLSAAQLLFMKCG